MNNSSTISISVRSDWSYCFLPAFWPRLGVFFLLHGLYRSTKSQCDVSWCIVVACVSEPAVSCERMRCKQKLPGRDSFSSVDQRIIIYKTVMSTISLLDLICYFFAVLLLCYVFNFKLKLRHARAKEPRGSIASAPHSDRSNVNIHSRYSDANDYKMDLLPYDVMPWTIWTWCRVIILPPYCSKFAVISVTKTDKVRLDDQFHQIFTHEPKHTLQNAYKGKSLDFGEIVSSLL